MKIAYCFYGNVGGLTKKAGEKTEGAEKVLEYSYNSFIKNVLHNNEFDFFIHSWNPDLNDLFEKYYSPKVLISDPQMVFDIPKHLTNNLRSQSHYSRWYSTKKIVDAKNTYCKENNVKYDLVILARHDLYWMKNIDFYIFNNNDINFDQCYTHGSKFSTKSHVGDRLISSNEDHINYLSELYDKLSEYTSPDQCPQYRDISSHFSIPWHLKKKNLTDLINFPYVWWGDGFTNKENASFTLVRDYYRLLKLTNN
jgi:hypothetical protein